MICAHHACMFTIPNLFTLVRLLLVPTLGYLLTQAEYRAALIVFLIAALTDFVDGFIARRFHSTSNLGATLDPIADKLSMLVATVLLCWQGLIPIWLGIGVVSRDVVIAVGALVYRYRFGRIEIAPTMLSKVNTALEFAVLSAAMAGAAQWISPDQWLTPAFALVFATVISSGLQYVWVWSRKAIRDARSA